MYGMNDRNLSLGHFVNPFTDLGFKIIFGQPASKDLLITLLNELLKNEHHIENLTFLDKENHSDSIDDAGIIYDLYCLTSTGEYIIVEMQKRRHILMIVQEKEIMLEHKEVRINQFQQVQMTHTQ